MNTSEDEPVDWEPIRKMAKLISDPRFKAVLDDYNRRFQSAVDFAGTPFNDSLYLLGLTLNGLDLIPPGTLIDKEPYWSRAPIPLDSLWESGSIVVPANL